MDRDILEPFEGSICDRLEGWELVEFLQISTEDVLAAFEDEVIEHLDDVLELVGLRVLRDMDDTAEEEGNDSNDYADD